MPEGLNSDSRKNAMRKAIPSAHMRRALRTRSASLDGTIEANGCSDPTRIAGSSRRRRGAHAMTITLRIIAALLALFAAGASHAQNYPTKQVRTICPYPPGGPTDVIARLVAQKLQEHLGGQFYVENLSGAGGALGAGNAANSAPDGS